MPSLRLASFFLGVEIRAELNIGARIEETPYIEAPPTQNDERERELSPVGQQMQKQARELVKQKRAEAEREADEESLNLLEAAEAASTTEARFKDRESLEWLIRCTKRLHKYRPTFKTPTRNFFWPKTRHIEGINGTPLSFEPSNSTPMEVREMYEGKTVNEFEVYLAKNRALEASEWLEEKKKSRNSFTALLESTKTTGDSSTATGAEWSKHLKSEVQSVIDLFDQVEKQDEVGSLAGQDGSPTPTSKKKSRNSSTALLESAKVTSDHSIGTPDSSEGASPAVGEDGSPSPTLSIKHLSQDNGYLLMSFDNEESDPNKPGSEEESEEGSEEDMGAEEKPDSAEPDENEWDFV